MHTEQKRKLGEMKEAGQQIIKCLEVSSQWEHYVPTAKRRGGRRDTDSLTRASKAIFRRELQERALVKIWAGCFKN